MGSTRFRNPPALSSVLAALGTLQLRAVGFLNRVDPLVSASNYYLLKMKPLNSLVLISLSVLLTVAMAQPEKWREGRAEVSGSGYEDTKCPNQLVGHMVSAQVPGCSDKHCMKARQKAEAKLKEYLMTHDLYDGEGCVPHIYGFTGCGKGPWC